MIINVVQVNVDVLDGLLWEKCLVGKNVFK
jgi:hypothetical protein